MAWQAKNIQFVISIPGHRFSMQVLVDIIADRYNYRLGFADGRDGLLKVYSDSQESAALP